MNFEYLFERYWPFVGRILHLCLRLTLAFTVSMAFIAHAGLQEDVGAASNAFDRDDHEQAIKLYSRILEYPDLSIELRDAAYFNRAIMYRTAGSYELAIDDFTKLIREEKYLYLSYLHRGMTYLFKGNNQAALKDLDAAIRLNRTSEALYSRGMIYRYSDDAKKALIDLEEALQVDPNNHIAFYERGVAYAMSGQYEKAIADFHHAIKYFPNEAKMYSSRGLAYLQNMQADRALTDFDVAIRLEPNNGEIYRRRGMALADLGRVKEALGPYAMARRLNPDNSDVYASEGKAYLRLLEVDKALDDFNTALRLNSLNELAYLNRGLAYMHKEEFKKALDDLDRVLHLDPQSADALGYRALAQIYLGNFELAMADLETAVSLKPKDIVNLRILGFLYFGLGQYQKAEDVFERQIRIANRMEASFWRHLSRVRMGKATATELEVDVAKMDISGWPRPLINFYLGKESLAELLVKAKHESKEIERFHLCQVALLRGELRIGVGDTKDASTLFKEAVKTCPYAYPERAFAEIELRKAGAVPSIGKGN